MRKNLFIKTILCLMILGILPSNAQSAGFVDGVATLNGYLLDKTPLKVEVRLKKVTPDYPYRRALLWGGDLISEEDVVMPKVLISTIYVLAGKKKLIIPLSAYSDLGNPSQVFIKSTSKGFQIIIRGGDAGTAYDAVLKFDARTITGRKVSHGEFPEQVWEETVYSFISEDSEM